MSDTWENEGGLVTEEFCAQYKGEHTFVDGSNKCRCGRAYLRAPRPLLPPSPMHTCLTSAGSPTCTGLHHTHVTPALAGEMDEHGAWACPACAAIPGK